MLIIGHHPDDCTDQPGGLADNLPRHQSDFQPREWFIQMPSTLDELHRGHVAEDYNEWHHLTCSGTFDELHDSELVIAVDGSCRNMNTRQVQCTIGVWFGRGESEMGNKWNVARKVEVQGNNAAELEAAIAGLVQYRKIIEADAREKDRTVIIKSDSSYVVDGILELLGGRAPNRPFELSREEQEPWLHLEELVHEFEFEGIQVLFLWVPREWNREADRMAQEGFTSPSRRNTRRRYGFSNAEYAAWEEDNQQQSQIEVEADDAQPWEYAE